MYKLPPTKKKCWFSIIFELYYLLDNAFPSGDINGTEITDCYTHVAQILQGDLENKQDK